MPRLVRIRRLVIVKSVKPRLRTFWILETIIRRILGILMRNFRQYNYKKWKLAELNNQLIFSDLLRSTFNDISIYIYLNLNVINILKPRKFLRDLCKLQALGRDPRISWSLNSNNLVYFIIKSNCILSGWKWLIINILSDQDRSYWHHALVWTLMRLSSYPLRQNLAFRKIYNWSH